MSIIGKIIGVVVLLVVVLVVIGVSVYATDYPVEGTVENKNCAANPPTVTIDAGLFGDQVVEVTSDQCAVLSIGNHVVYHIRSGRTTIYEREGGRCLYDSETGYYCGSASNVFPMG